MISVKHLTKYYGDHLAVDDISIEIAEGHVYGFLGPNGAGKSTTMNITDGTNLFSVRSPASRPSHGDYTHQPSKQRKGVESQWHYFI